MRHASTDKCLEPPDVMVDECAFCSRISIGIIPHGLSSEPSNEQSVEVAFGPASPTAGRRG